MSRWSFMHSTVHLDITLVLMVLVAGHASCCLRSAKHLGCNFASLT